MPNTGLIEDLFVAIPWNDGSNDNIYLDFSKLTQGDNTIRVSSDINNTNKERSRVFEFKGVASFDNPSPDIQPSAVLNVVQQPNNYLVVTFNQVYPIYEEVNTGGM